MFVDLHWASSFAKYPPAYCNKKATTRKRVVHTAVDKTGPTWPPSAGGRGGGLLTDSPPPQPGGQNIGPNLAPNMTLEGAYNNVAFSVNNLVQRNTTVHGVEFFVNEQRKEQ